MSEDNDPKGIILCVDDNIEFCKLVMDFFLERGYDVMPALTAEEGYEIIKKYKIDMLLLDIRMKGMGGIGLLNKLNKEKIEIPTLVITAFPQDIQRIKTEKFNICGYFEKPVRLNDVYNAIKEHLKNNSPAK